MDKNENPSIRGVRMYRHVLCMSEKLLCEDGGPFATDNNLDPGAIRRVNRRNIGRLLYKERGLTKQELCGRLELSMPTVTAILQDMQADGQIEVRQTTASGAGRPPSQYFLRGNAHICAAMMINRENIDILIEDIYRRELLRETVQKEYEDTAEYWQSAAEHLAERLEMLEAEPRAVIGVNVLLPCQVDPVEQCVVEESDDFPAGAFSTKLLSDILDVPVMVNNTYDAAAYEAVGRSAANRSGICLHISDIVDATYVVSGRILRSRASEIGSAGHSCLVPGGRTCRCGKMGCVEAYCGTGVFKKELGLTLGEFLNSERGVKASLFWYNYLRDTAIFIANLINISDLPVYLCGELADEVAGSEDFGVLRDMVSGELPERRRGEAAVNYGGPVESLALDGAVGILILNFI